MKKKISLLCICLLTICLCACQKTDIVSETVLEPKETEQNISRENQEEQQVTRNEGAEACIWFQVYGEKLVISLTEWEIVRGVPPRMAGLGATRQDAAGSDPSALRYIYPFR